MAHTTYTTHTPDEKQQQNNNNFPRRHLLELQKKVNVVKELRNNDVSAGVHLFLQPL
jgi:hypothetical protein